MCGEIVWEIVWKCSMELGNYAAEVQCRTRKLYGNIVDHLGWKEI